MNLSGSSVTQKLRENSQQLLLQTSDYLKEMRLCSKALDNHYHTNFFHYACPATIDDLKKFNILAFTNLKKLNFAFRKSKITLDFYNSEYLKVAKVRKLIYGCMPINANFDRPFNEQFKYQKYFRISESSLTNGTKIYCLEQFKDDEKPVKQFKKIINGHFISQILTNSENILKFASINSLENNPIEIVAKILDHIQLVIFLKDYFSDIKNQSEMTTKLLYLKCKIFKLIYLTEKVTSNQYHMQVNLELIENDYRKSDIWTAECDMNNLLEKVNISFKTHFQLNLGLNQLNTIHRQSTYHYNDLKNLYIHNIIDLTTYSKTSEEFIKLRNQLFNLFGLSCINTAKAANNYKCSWMQNTTYEVLQNKIIKYHVTDISCDKNQIIKFEKIETYVGQLTEGFESHINRIFNQICHDLGDPVQICSQNIFSQVSIPRLNIEKLSVAVATKIVKFSVLLNNLVTHYLAKKIFIITANIFNIWAETIHSELRLTPHNSTTRILKIYNHID